MATLADSLVSASARRLSLRKRNDLVVTQQRHQGRIYFVVKDPVGLGYFRLRQEEYAVLEMLDGQTSLDQIKEQFEKKFAPQQLSLKQLQWFIGQLHRSGLILSNVPGQGEQLLFRRNEKLWQELKGKLANVLALRFKGIDPELLLTWMNRKLWWIYTPQFIWICIALWMAALTLVLVQFDTFQAKLPAFHEFFQAKNAMLMFVALGVTKVIHEFGHGLTCKHFGGECHEMGFMLLVFSPCLYCNVSDSWMLTNKWHRVYISIGGIFVELCIASVCTFIWWFTQPGVLNYLCLSVMFICSVSTIFFNGNPLLRYDGYYVVSDLLEIPNLWQKSRSVLNKVLGQLCLGLPWQPDPFLPEKGHFWFGAYAVASSIYRWFVTLSILWFLHQVFKPYRLEVLGMMLAMVSVVGLVAMPAYSVFKFFWIPGRLNQVKPIRVVVSMALLALAVALVLFFPLPRRVFTTFVVEPRDADRVYVVVPGEIQEVLVSPGEWVKKGAVLARLRNPDLDLEISQLEGQVAEQKLFVKNLEVRRLTSSDAAAVIGAANANLKATQERLADRNKDRNRLELRAPSDGYVLPPPVVPEPTGARREKELREWIGVPFDSRNRFAYLKTGALFCMIGYPNRLEAILVIDQGDIEFVAEKQSVDLKTENLAYETFQGQIAEIAKGELDAAPAALSQKAGGELQTRSVGNGQEAPASTSYQAKVPLNYDDKRILLSMAGRAKIHAGYTTLSQILWRYFRQTFTFAE